MTAQRYLDLGRRERQIMDAIYRLGRASVSEVRRELPDPPSYSAVRAMLGKLEEKELLAHEEDGPRYMYFPLQSGEEDSRSALRRLLSTFFEDSVSKAVAALLEASDREITPEELDALERLIDDARRSGR